MNGAVAAPISRERRTTASAQDCGLSSPCSWSKRKRSAPGDQRAEQELVVDQDHDQHGADRPEDGVQVALGDGDRDIEPIPGRVTVVWPTLIALGRHHEEPAAGHRHHHVPHQRRHGEGRVDPPEPRPGGEAEQPPGFGQVARDGAQRLIEAEGHVPGLTGEDGEHRRQLGPEHPSGRQRHEEDDGDGDEAEDRHRLEDVQERDQDRAGARALGRPGGIGEGEDQRCPERDEPAQRGAQRVFRQVGRIERDRGAGELGQGLQQKLAGAGEQDDEAEDEQRRQHVPRARQEATGPDRDGRYEHREAHGDGLGKQISGLSGRNINQSGGRDKYRREL
ncbi:MAG: hypothetical protein WDN03_11860 [Rhizomicrobium sp.]